MTGYILRTWIVVLVASLSLADEEHCPKLSTSSPCTCTYGIFNNRLGTKVECSKINSKDILLDEVQKFKGYHIDSLKFKNLQLSFLPAGLSLGLSVSRIYIEDSHIGNLYSPQDSTPSPFDGLEQSLEEFHISNTHEPTKWYWPDVKKFKKIQKISITDSPLNFVGHNFAEIGEGSLKSIAVRHSNVYRVHPQAFPELTNLVHADFEGNYLPYLVRTMFPNPAPQLQILNFRDNRLFTLNENMFENMPALIFLDLSRNEFKQFESTPFSPLWNQLQFLFLSDNPFECGCSLSPLKSRLLSGTLPKSNDFRDIKCTNTKNGEYRKEKLAELDTNALRCKKD